MHKIFISYSRSDYPTVIKIKDEIENLIEAGLCWIDMSGIESDSQFIDVIIDAIDSSDIFLFMYSKHSEHSEWTRKEIEYANGEHKRIVFVKIDGTQLSKYFKFQFGGHDIIDISDNLQKRKLFNDIRRWCGLGYPTENKNNTRKEEENSNKSTSNLFRSFFLKFKSLSFSHFVKSFLCILAKGVSCLNIFLAIICLSSVCTDGYDSEMHSLTWFMLILTLICFILEKLNLVNININSKREGFILFGIPLLLYSSSMVIGVIRQDEHRNTNEQDNNPADTTIVDSIIADSVASTSKKEIISHEIQHMTEERESQKGIQSVKK